MPMIKAAWHWLSAVLRFTTSPQSCTATIFLTFTIPVSGSTSTSAICTPPTPLLVRSGGLSLSGFLPRTVSGIAPSFEQASFQLSDLLESPFTRTVPFAHSSRWHGRDRPTCERKHLRRALHRQIRSSRADATFASSPSSQKQWPVLRDKYPDAA